MKANTVAVKPVDPLKQVVTSNSIPIPKEPVLPINGQKINALEAKFLQPEQVIISKESQDKLSRENEANSLDTSSGKTTENINATEEDKQTKITGISKDEQVESSSDTKMRELDDVIAELEMRILELTVEIELLKAKGDEESIKEAEKLEIDLVMLRGVLEAKLQLKLDIVKTSS